MGMAPMAVFSDAARAIPNSTESCSVSLCLENNEKRLTPQDWHPLCQGSHKCRTTRVSGSFRQCSRSCSQDLLIL